MNGNKIFIFGYGKNGRQIAKTLSMHHNVVIVDSEEQAIKKAYNDGFEHTHCIDLTEDSEISKLGIVQRAKTLICAMDDESMNIFLVISLRALFEEVIIISISDSVETNQKLLMAGANKVIDIYDPGSTRIFNILEKPYVLKVFDILFHPDSKISFNEFPIPENSFLVGKTVSEVDFRAHHLILVGIVDLEYGEHFTFATHGFDHKLDYKDILVCMGKDADLERFARRIEHNGKEKE